MEKQPNETPQAEAPATETPAQAVQRRFDNGGMSRAEYDAAMADIEGHPDKVPPASSRREPPAPPRVDDQTGKPAQKGKA